MAFASRVLHREYTECERWRELVVDRLAKAKPDLVIVSVARTPSPLTAADDSPTKQGHALAHLLDRIPGQKVIIVDTPQFNVDPPSCLSSHRSDTGRCAMTWSTAFGWRHLILERTAAKDTPATIIDLSTTICPDRLLPGLPGRLHHVPRLPPHDRDVRGVTGRPGGGAAAARRRPQWRGDRVSLTASSARARAASRSIWRTSDAASRNRFSPRWRRTNSTRRRCP